MNRTKNYKSITIGF